MRAIVTAGGSLAWQEVPDPVAGSGEVLIAVAAAGVNRADLLQAAGKYPPPPGASEILGLEVSGVIAATGSGVTGLAVGAPVCALLAGGGYAERVAVPAQQVMPVPDGVGLLDAAALPEVACTVWSNLAGDRLPRPGTLVLVHGGAGGIGSHAIQVARTLGLRVAATAGSAAKLALCAELGAEVLINYRDDDFVARVRQADPSGAALILDIMGAAYLDRNLAALSSDGTLVIIGMQGGVTAELNIGSLIARRLTVAGTALRGRPVEGPAGKAAIVAAVIKSVWPMVADGRVRPVIGARLPIEQAAEGHRMLAAGEVSGKILLSVPDRR